MLQIIAKVVNVLSNTRCFMLCFGSSTINVKEISDSQQLCAAEF